MPPVDVVCVDLHTVCVEKLLKFGLGCLALCPLLAQFVITFTRFVWKNCRNMGCVLCCPCEVEFANMEAVYVYLSTYRQDTCRFVWCTWHVRHRTFVCNCKKILQKLEVWKILLCCNECALGKTHNLLEQIN